MDFNNNCRDRILSDAYGDLIIDFEPPARELFPERIRDYCIVPVGDYRMIYVNRSELSPFSESLYSYVNTPNLYGLMQNEFDPTSLIESGITGLQRPPLSLRGEGTIIAFIDTGIDYTLDIFKDEAGNSRILSIWDQEEQSGVPPEGFLYGSEYKGERINEALASENPYEIVPSRDELRHGTSMAGVAAGSSIDNGRTYVGAAPGADIVVVKLKQCKQYLRDFYLLPDNVPAYSETDVMLGVKYAREFATSFERPVIICLGIGTNQGNHAGTSALARYLSQVAASRSCAVVVGGGNEGNSAHHFAGRLQTGNNDVNNYEDVEIRVDSGVKGFVMEMWGNNTDILYISIRSPGGESIQPMRIRQGGSGGSYGFVFEDTRITIYNFFVEQSTGEELIVIRFEAPTEGVWNIRVLPQGAVYNGEYNMWLPIRQFITGDVYFLRPNPYITMTEPAFSENVITVTSYNDMNNSFYQESGRGFAANDRIKPEMSAPGVNISTIYGAQTGSSLAAAITAGAVAQFMQWAVVEGNRILIDGVETKSYFIRGASRDGDITYPSEEWGYGRLDAVGVFEVISRV